MECSAGDAIRQQVFRNHQGSLEWLVTWRGDVWVFAKILVDLDAKRHHLVSPYTHISLAAARKQALEKLMYLIMVHQNISWIWFLIFWKSPMSALQKHKSTKGFFKEILRIFLKQPFLKTPVRTLFWNPRGVKFHKCSLKILWVLRNLFLKRLKCEYRRIYCCHSCCWDNLNFFHVPRFFIKTWRILLKGMFFTLKMW